MTSEQFIKFREMIEREYSNAVTKHPKFCDVYSTKEPQVVRKSLKHLRERNSTGPLEADTILYEEVAEATESFIQGDKAHCLQELAQCGAVILRMMEFVEANNENI